MVLTFNLGDRITLKKSHPCGSDEWLVIRIGMDIGLKCKKCGHNVILSRHVLERRIKKTVSSCPSEKP